MMQRDPPSRSVAPHREVAALPPGPVAASTADRSKLPPSSPADLAGAAEPAHSALDRFTDLVTGWSQTCRHPAGSAGTERTRRSKKSLLTGPPDDRWHVPSQPVGEFESDCLIDLEPLADGASYHPDTDTWRPVAEAPVPFVEGSATWTGAEVL